MKEYTVIKEMLNIRNAPTDADDSSFIGQLFSGDNLFLNEKPVVGTIPKGGTNDLWLGDELNRFVALDGLRLSDWETQKEQLIAAVKIMWQQSKGQGVAVALLDSGVVEGHPLLSTNLKHFGVAEIPTKDHGTRMAGLLIAKESPDFLSFCPDATLYDYKIFQKDRQNAFSNMIAALQDLVKKDEVRIINLSLEFEPDDFGDDEKQQADDLMEQCIKTGKILVAATGNNQRNITYPGNSPLVITIGALRNNTALNFPNGIEPNEVTKNPDAFIAFGSWQFLSFTGSTTDANINSSEATAICSALIALKLGATPSLTQKEIGQLIVRSREPLFQNKGLHVFRLNIEKFLNLKS